MSRVLEIASGELQLVDTGGQGVPIGTTDSTLVTYASCPGLPCAILAHDIATGTHHVLSHEAFEASLRLLPDGNPTVSITSAEGTMEVSL